MRILLSNDDGYFAPGLAALAEGLSRLGEITVVAPERDRSGASNSLTLDRPLSLRSAHNGFHYVNGTPTDCVHMAVTGILDFEPDVVVSGINSGSNMGDDTLYSGTVAAAMEGFLFGIQAIAFSQVQKGWEHLDAAGRVARAVIRQVLQRPPKVTPYLLNVNIPNRADADRLPSRVTRLGRRHASEPVIRQVSPRGETLYWIGPAGDAREAGPGTDFHATSNGEISVTPLHVDLTDHASLPAWRDWANGAD